LKLYLVALTKKHRGAAGISNRELKPAVGALRGVDVVVDVGISNRELKRYAKRFGVDEQTLAGISNRELKPAPL